MAHSDSPVSPAMTVAELIVILQALPQDYAVCIATTEEGTYGKWDDHIRDIMLDSKRKEVTFDNWPAFDF